jgi:hypothetical protein
MGMSEPTDSLHVVQASIALACALLAAPSDAAGSYAQLEGFWQCQEEGVRSTLEFTSQSTLIYDGQSASYQMLPNVLRVQGGDGPVDYLYEIQDGTLVVLSPDGTVAYCQKATKPTLRGQQARKPAQPRSQRREDPSQGREEGWPPRYARPRSVDEESPSPQALLYKFAGRWDHVTPNTLTNLFLKPDGTYEEAYEAGYSGTFSDQGGYQTGNWGATGTEQARGMWRIEGSLRQGRIYLIDQAGKQTALEYQVHVERGETYWGEYFFNGKLYSAKYIYR